MPELWIKELFDYLVHIKLPEDHDNAVRIKKSSARYLILDERLYGRGFCTPLLRCLTKNEAECVPGEIHAGPYGSHVGGRSLGAKIQRASYFWPTVNKDINDYVRRCDKCQHFANIQRAPPSYLQSILSPRPFHTWGENILGPFPPTPSLVKYIIVAIAYLPN